MTKQRELPRTVIWLMLVCLAAKSWAAHVEVADEGTQGLHFRNSGTDYDIDYGGSRRHDVWAETLPLDDPANEDYGAELGSEHPDNDSWPFLSHYDSAIVSEHYGDVFGADYPEDSWESVMRQDDLAANVNNYRADSWGSLPYYAEGSAPMPYHADDTAGGDDYGSGVGVGYQDGIWVSAMHPHDDEASRDHYEDIHWGSLPFPVDLADDSYGAGLGIEYADDGWGLMPYSVEATTGDTYQDEGWEPVRYPGVVAAGDSHVAGFDSAYIGHGWKSVLDPDGLANAANYDTIALDGGPSQISSDQPPLQQQQHGES